MSFFHHEVIQAAELENPTTAQAIDIDGDSDFDVLTVSEKGVSWFENLDGNGTFSAARLVSHRGLDLGYVTPGDFDGDGDVDVVTATLTYPFDWIVDLHENTGSEFQRKPNALPSSFDAEWHPNHNATSTDIDGDGDIDILGQGFGSSAPDGGIAWLENSDGKGTFTDFNAINLNSLHTAIHAADIDSDGDQDLLTILDGYIAWLENSDNKGAFSPAQTVSESFLSLSNLATADFDNDDDLDLLSWNSNNQIVFFENTNGTGLFADGVIVSEARFSSVSIGDIDADGDQDILIVKEARGNKLVWLENIGGEFAAEQSIASELSGWNLGASLADLNGDGRQDLLTTSESQDEIAWYENLGQGQFGPKQFVGQPGPEQRLASLRTADVDSDGSSEVVVAGDGILAYYETNGTPRLAAKQIIDSDVDSIHTVDIRDVDGDGSVDIVTYSNSEPRVAWYRNEGGGDFSEASTVSTTEFHETAQMFDFDDDGDLDFVYFELAYGTQPWSSRIGWAENVDGRGTFEAPQALTTSDATLSSIVATDVDGDGDNDLLATALEESSLSWFENSEGHFDQERKTLWEDWPVAFDNLISVGVADLDADGGEDIFIQHELEGVPFSYGLMVLRQNGVRTPEPPAELITNRFMMPEAIPGSYTGLRDFRFTDVDGENGLDVISASSSLFGSDLTWTRNAVEFGFETPSYDDEVRLPATDGVALVDAGDIDGDGDVDLISATDSGAITIYENRQVIFGDADRNGEVNFADFLALSANYGERADAAWAEGDFTGDGRVTFSDFLLLSSQFANAGA